MSLSCSCVSSMWRQSAADGTSPFLALWWHWLSSFPGGRKRERVVASYLYWSALMFVIAEVSLFTYIFPYSYLYIQLESWNVTAVFLYSSICFVIRLFRFLFYTCFGNLNVCFPFHKAPKNWILHWEGVKVREIDRDGWARREMEEEEMNEYTIKGTVWPF